MLKSWKEKFDGKDVEKFLNEQGLDNWDHDCICGDGDIMLRFAETVPSVALDELVKIKSVFNPKSLVVEAGFGENEDKEREPLIYVTLSWNN